MRGSRTRQPAIGSGGYRAKPNSASDVRKRFTESSKLTLTQCGPCPKHLAEEARAVLRAIEDRSTLLTYSEFATKMA
jgi:hypothetical protein